MDEAKHDLVRRALILPSPVMSVEAASETMQGLEYPAPERYNAQTAEYNTRGERLWTQMPKKPPYV